MQCVVLSYPDALRLKAHIADTQSRLRILYVYNETALKVCNGTVCCTCLHNGGADNLLAIVVNDRTRQAKAVLGRHGNRCQCHCRAQNESLKYIIVHLLCFSTVLLRFFHLNFD